MKELRKIYRYLKYYDKALNMKQSKVDSIKHDNIKEIKRFDKETKFVTKLMMIHILRNFPFAKSYDPIENPRQIPTFVDVEKLVKSDNQSVREVGGINVIGLGEEFETYNKFYSELTIPTKA